MENQSLFGAAVKEVRANSALTQRQLAESIGVRRERISKLESRHPQVQRRALRNLSGVPQDQLLTFVSWDRQMLVKQKLAVILASELAKRYEDATLSTEDLSQLVGGLIKPQVLARFETNTYNFSDLNQLTERSAGALFHVLGWTPWDFSRSDLHALPAGGSPHARRRKRLERRRSRRHHPLGFRRLRTSHSIL